MSRKTKSVIGMTGTEMSGMELLIATSMQTEHFNGKYHLLTNVNIKINTEVLRTKPNSAMK